MIGNMRGDEETKNKLIEWKAPVATMGIKNADLKDQFFFLEKGNKLPYSA